MPQQTYGEYLVGAGVDPSCDDQVEALKQFSACFIDMIESVPNDRLPGIVGNSAIGRLKSIAITHVETAVMFALKAATKPERE